MQEVLPLLKLLAVLDMALDAVNLLTLVLLLVKLELPYMLLHLASAVPDWNYLVLEVIVSVLHVYVPVLPLLQLVEDLHLVVVYIQDDRTDEAIAQKCVFKVSTPFLFSLSMGFADLIHTHIDVRLQFIFSKYLLKCRLRALSKLKPFVWLVWSERFVN